MAYPALTPQARELLALRYLQRGPGGDLCEDEEGFFRRVAAGVAAAEVRFGGRAEPKAERYHDLLRTLRFLPNSPALMNAGLPSGQLAACFVLPLEDSIESIYDSLKHMALIHKSGGGTGFSFSRLRPEGDVVASTGGVASGPLSFLELFDTSTRVIRQGGRRRGANMAVLRIDHPDILAFCRAKLGGRLANFNLSAGVTDGFFRALARGEDLELVNPRNGAARGRVPAAEIFGALVEGAWTTGDPGAIFLDAVNRENPVPHLGPLEATNPCGEQPLLPYESCTLGSLVLPRFLRGQGLDWEGLEAAAGLAVEFLDDCIEVSVPPVDAIRQANRRTRKVGLGVMGLADLLAALGIPYASPEARALGHQVMARIEAAGVAASRALGERRGSFEAFPGSRWEERGFRAMRNATVTTVAPTGSIAVLAGVSGSIEPFFSLAYTRRIQGRPVNFGLHPRLRPALEAQGVCLERVEARVRADGRVGHLPEVPEAVRRVFVTAFELAPADHLAMQAAFQAHTHNAVSKTINLPAESSRETVAEIFREAHALGLKGVTLYRYGALPEQPLEVGEGCTRCTGPAPEAGAP